MALLPSLNLHLPPLLYPDLQRGLHCHMFDLWFQPKVDVQVHPDGQEHQQKECGDGEGRAERVPYFQCMSGPLLPFLGGDAAYWGGWQCIFRDPDC